MTIENLARRVAGAVFLATPDGDSVIRQQQVRTPRANVLFEYGYLTAMLIRSRVALCRYTGAELPSDFAGVTYVPMGTFEPNKPIDHQAIVRLKSWATELPAIQVGFSPTCQMHGYSGCWQAETVYEVYRRIQVKDPDYVVLNGRMILQIPPDGNGGAGCFFGNLQVQIGGCYAEFEISDPVIDAKVFGDGSMTIRTPCRPDSASDWKVILRRGTDSRPIFEALGRSIYSYTVPLASLASSAGASQVRSEATFTPRQPESGTGSARGMHAQPHIRQWWCCPRR